MEKISQYLPQSIKTGNVNPWRTLSRSFFVIPEHLTSIRAVVLTFAVFTNCLRVKHSRHIEEMATRARTLASETYFGPALTTLVLVLKLGFHSSC